MCGGHDPPSTAEAAPQIAMSRFFQPAQAPKRPGPTRRKRLAPQTQNFSERERRRSIGSSRGPTIDARRERCDYYDFVTISSTPCADVFGGTPYIVDKNV
jgi:hypothetical protein